MSSSTKIDVNYLSVGGNNIWAMNNGSPEARVVDTPTDWNLSNVDGKKYASILKLADGVVFTQVGLVVPQGNECAVDVNNHGTVDIQGDFGSDNFDGNQIFSVKGNSSAKIAGILHGSGNRMGADVLVDNWSDQSYSGSTVDLTNAKHSTGRKIAVVKRYGASNVVLGNNAKIDVLHSIELTVYWWVKWLVRKVMGIKVGTKGPSWI
jgi:hypothetical protein